MSWHFLQEQEDVSSEAICWDGEQFAPSSGPTTLGAYCLPVSEMASSPDSLSGTTCRPSMETPGAGASMLSPVGSHARTSAQPARAQGSPESDPGCGRTWPASSAKYDPASRSWRTAQCSLFEVLGSCLETFPRWGIMRDGEFWELPTPERHTSGTESGLWPTIRAQDGERGGRGDLIQAVRGNENSHFRMWQTPVADDAVDRAAGKFNSRGEPKLSAQVKFPTPLTRDWKSGTGADHGAHSPPLSSVVGGQLNPDWTEWLMGWPIGWTDLKPLETDKFQQWQQQHSAFSRKG
jgi:hypothetical protein